MLRTDLDTPLLSGLPVVTRPPSHFVRLTCSGILIITCTFFGFSQCLAQDVAEAARQAKAQKENQQKKSKHVYTEEDLKHPQILTPEDRAEVEARRKQQPPPGAEKSEDAIDAEALPIDEPLGDVARRYRRMRESLRLQESAEFHLPFGGEPVLATPKTSVNAEPEAPVLSEPKAPLLAAPKFPVLILPKTPVHVSPKAPVLPHGTVLSIPPAPQIEPFQPPVKRSPFERPRVFLSAPPRVASSQPRTNHVAPPQAPAVGAMPAQPSTIPVSPAKPSAPVPSLSKMPSPAPAHRGTPVQPVAPAVHIAPAHPSTIPVAPAKPSAPAPNFGLMPSPTPATAAKPVQPVAPSVRMAPAQPLAIHVSPVKPAASAPDMRVMPSPAPSHRVAPEQPTAPVVRMAPANPATISVPTVKPAAPAPSFSEMPAPTVTPRGAATQPAAPVVRMAPASPATIGVTPSQPVAPAVRVTPAQPTAPSRTASAGPARLSVMTVKPGDSLWKLAEEILGKGQRWHDLVAVNPAIVDPDRIMAGSQIYLPSLVASAHTASKYTVRKGDTLSQIALSQLGRASSWACIAHANPAIHDANLILEGQLLVLPASCTL